MDFKTQRINCWELNNLYLRDNKKHSIILRITVYFQSLFAIKQILSKNSHNEAFVAPLLQLRGYPQGHISIYTEFTLPPNPHNYNVHQERITFLILKAIAQTSINIQVR